MDWLALRASYVYDESPIDGNEGRTIFCPPVTRDVYGLGAGFRLSDAMVLDVNYSYLVQHDRTVNQRQIDDGVLASEYQDGMAHLFGVSLSYNF